MNKSTYTTLCDTPDLIVMINMETGNMYAIEPTGMRLLVTMPPDKIQLNFRDRNTPINYIEQIKKWATGK
jgi:DUF917 family protein